MSDVFSLTASIDINGSNVVKEINKIEKKLICIDMLIDDIGSESIEDIAKLIDIESKIVYGWLCGYEILELALKEELRYGDKTVGEVIDIINKESRRLTRDYYEKHIRRNDYAEAKDILYKGGIIGWEIIKDF